jgi:carbonic anhydrase/acetyltransferase-like protein (isoleucine patch superfamily)
MVLTGSCVREITRRFDESGETFESGAPQAVHGTLTTGASCAHSKSTGENMAIYSIGDNHPSIAPTAWVAPGAHVMGKIELADNASIWFGAILRGDNEPIRIGVGSNVQENAVLHTDHKFPLTVGNHVTIGHQAMLHGCTVGDGSLIGIQAVVMNGAKIGRECLIGAGALIPEGKEIPDRSLVMGAPGKVIRELTAEEVARIRAGVDNYIAKAASMSTQLKRIDT